MLRLVVLAVSLTMCSNLAGETLRARIEVNETSVVNQTQFTLGEIARFSGMDANTQQQLAKIVIGSSPLPGLERVVTREQVITRLRQYGFHPEMFEINMPKRATVRREAYSLNVQRVVETAIHQLRQTLSLPEEAEVTCDTPPRDIPLPKQEPVLVAAPPRALGEGLYLVPVEVQCEGAPASTLSVRLRVRWNRAVVVALRALKAGEIVSPEAVTVQVVSLARDDARVATAPQQVIGKTLTRPLRAGQPVPTDALENPPLIRRGQLVKIQLRLPGATIETTATALQEGGTGARIRVQVTDTRKIVTATVLDAETVSLETP